MIRKTLTVALAALTAALVGCGTPGSASSDRAAAEAAPAVAETQALDVATLSKPGFVVEVEDGRLWVRRPDQPKSDKHVTWVAAGPGGATLKAPDADTALAYLATKPGFRVEIEDGRIWVLRDDQQKSERCVTRIGAGPRGATVKAVDAATLAAYLAAS